MAIPVAPERILRASLPRAEHLLLQQTFGRIWIAEQSANFGTVSDAELDRLTQLGFDALWLMGVWELGVESPAIAKAEPGLKRDFDANLPGWTAADVIGSPYAVARYAVDPRYGGDAALALLRRRLVQRGIGLILDFVPNHLARDHHWIRERPELFVREADGKIACGRDPYFPAWTDTAQLDYRLSATREAMIAALLEVAGRCDGVRCDMSMLLLESVFHRTWAAHPPREGATLASGEFWAQAIDAVRAQYPGFLFIAEAYWGLEGRLQNLGFDFTYDKTLYDRLLHDPAQSIRAHLEAPNDLMRRSVRFLENHDEPRIASLLEAAQQKAATVLAMTTPGMRMFHDGQLEGRKRRSMIHLARRAEEPTNAELLEFHRALLQELSKTALRTGSFRPLAPRSAWPGNDSFGRLIAHRWEHPKGSRLVIVNYGSEPAQARLTIELAGLGGRRVTLRDPINLASFERDGDELLDPDRGLYVDLPGWGFHFFEVTARV